MAGVVALYIFIYLSPFFAGYWRFQWELEHWPTALVALDLLLCSPLNLILLAALWWRQRHRPTVGSWCVERTDDSVRVSCDSDTLGQWGMALLLASLLSCFVPFGMAIVWLPGLLSPRQQPAILWTLTGKALRRPNGTTIDLSDAEELELKGVHLNLAFRDGTLQRLAWDATPESAHWLSRELGPPLNQVEESGPGPIPNPLPLSYPAGFPRPVDANILVPVGWCALMAFFAVLSFVSLLAEPTTPTYWFSTCFSAFLCLNPIYLFCQPAKIRIFPYYPERIPEGETYLSGQALARNCGRLDRLAQGRGLSSLGFPDALRGETVHWHDPSRGLDVVHRLLDLADQHPAELDHPSEVVRELLRLKHAFELADRRGIKFSMLVDEGDGTSAMVWEIRKGHPC